MKKVIVLMLCFVMAFGLFGCSNNNTELLAEIERLKSENESLRQGSDITEVEDVNAEPTPDETADEGLWQIKYYVDEFKQPTSDGYISTKDVITGTFSNSATTNSKLYVKFIIDKDDIAISLYEYGSNLVKNSSSQNSEAYNITMKTDDDRKQDIKGTMYAGTDRIFIDSSYKTTVLNALKKEGNLSFYIVQADRTTTTYLFIVEASNFAEEYELLE